LPTKARREPLKPKLKKNRRVPVDLPSVALMPASVRLFNFFYYRRTCTDDALVDLDTYFYPLDSLLEWNRIYGRRGFVQYQCVLPLAKSRPGMRALLSAISEAGAGSFLAVLKRTGAQSFGHLSFPLAGYTLALDFPVTDANMALLNELDRIMLEHDGRIYLAKDARADAQTVARGYPRLDEFRKVREAWKLRHKFRSLQSQRLDL
jgi:hypothetical protein